MFFVCFKLRSSFCIKTFSVRLFNKIYFMYLGHVVLITMSNKSLVHFVSQFRFCTFQNKRRAQKGHFKFILPAILDFVKFWIKEKVSKKLNKAFTGFRDHINIGLDTKIVSLGSLELEILPFTHFEGGNYEFL